MAGKGKKTRRNVKRRAPQQRMTRVRSTINYGSAAKALQPAVVGLVNPFAPEAMGCKIPDDDSTPSFTAQIRNIVSIAADANGAFGFTAGPQPDTYNGRLLTLDGNLLITATTNINNPDSAAYSAQMDSYRIVSWGIRIYCTLPDDKAKGSIRICSVDANPSAIAGLDNTQSLLFPEVYTGPIKNLDAYWISRPTGVTWKQYVSPGNFAPWTYCLVTATGLDASQSGVLQVEYIYNVEVIPKFGSITSVLATPAAPSNPATLAASSTVHAKRRNAHENRSSLFTQVTALARDALMDVASAYVPVIGGALRNAIVPRRQVPMIVD